MTDMEYKNLSRTEMLSFVLKLSSENEALKTQLAQLHTQQDDSEIKMERVGSMPEAAKRLNELFASAEATATKQMEELQKAEALCAMQQKKAEEDAANVIAAAQSMAQKRLHEAQQRAELVTKNAKTEADLYWNNISQKIERFLEESEGLRAFLGNNSK